MSNVNPASPGENTSVLVSSMRKQRRSSRLLIIVGTIGLAGLLTIMVFGIGSKREDSYKVDFTKVVSGAPEVLSAGGHSGELATNLGVVEIHLKSGGQLWVDGRNHGSASNHVLKLPPGVHTLLIKHEKRKPISKAIDVSANRTTQWVF